MSDVETMLEIRRTHRFTVEDYERMGEVGILGPEDRVELLEGEIFDLTPIGPAHAGTVKRVNHVLSIRLGGRAVVGVQDPVRLGTFSEPQPDVVLLRPRADFYAAVHPGAEDVLLLVEVSDSTLVFDRKRKLPIYARHGVAQVWIVNVNDRVVEVYRLDAGGTYAAAEILWGDDRLVIDALPDVVVTATEILG